MKKHLRQLLAALLLALFALGLTASLAETALRSDAFAASASADDLLAKSKKKKKNKATATPKWTEAATPAPTPSPEAEKESQVTVSPVPDGPITDPQSIADYIFANGRLPDNFITKREAQALGWDSSYNYVGDVAPGKSIGGDRFGNYEGLLPTAKGRQYYECDCWYTGKKRNAYRIIYSNDGLVYYTADHYQTFIQLFPSDVATNVPPTPTPRY